MNIEETSIKDCFLIKPKVFQDHRGSFCETFNQALWKKHHIPTNYIQDNQSVSIKGTLRGLHFQTGKYAQAKLVRAALGEVQDIVVDLRPNSTTFKKVVSVVLNDQNFHQLYVPKGCAHGFLVLSTKAIFCYKVDQFYAPEHESGISYNDPDLKLPWKLEDKELFLSDKDKKLPTLKDFLETGQQ